MARRRGCRTNPVEGGVTRRPTLHAVCRAAEANTTCRLFTEAVNKSRTRLYADFIEWRKKA